jgi:hypothetical protein
MALRVPVLVVGERRLRHQRAQTSVVGLFGEHHELLVDDRELVTEGSQTAADIGEAALDRRCWHDDKLMVRDAL